MSGEYSAEDSSIMYLIESIIKELNDETIENVFMSKISSYGQNLIDSLSNNNGISTTAPEIKTSTADDGTLLITSFTNLQIINGGQTTATLAITSIKNNADLSGIYVQMKLTVLKELIGKKILFEYIEKVISDQIWYQEKRAYRPQLIEYTFAKWVYQTKKVKKYINYRLI